jgi:hypothetical protein
VNAPARITVPDDGYDETADLYQWSEAERAHRASISIHCPNEGADAMRLRVFLAVLRDKAGAGMRCCCDEAFPVLREVQRQATEAVYAPHGPGKLYLKWLAITSLMSAARLIERANK